MITRDQFNQEVALFEARYNLSLEDFLQDDTCSLAFFGNNIIRGYLSRPFHRIEFADNHPLFDEELDRYELAIYKTLPNLIAYRNDQINTVSFYTDGSACYRYLMKLIRLAEPIAHDIALYGPYDIYKIANEIVSPQFCHLEGKASPRFKIFANMKDAHSTTVLSIVDPHSQRSLINILINSWNNIEAENSYYEYSKVRLLMDQFYSSEEIQDANFEIEPRLNISVAETELKRLFSIDFKSFTFPEKPVLLAHYPADKWTFYTDYKLGIKRVNNVCKDQQESVVCFINPTNASEYTYIGKRIDNVDKIYTIKRDAKNNKNYIIDLRYKPNEIFVDASHHLQIGENDANCSLYSFNFVKAIIRLLNDTVNKETIFQLAQKAAQKDNDAKNQLIRIFQHDLKRYLPEYYEQWTGTPKTLDALKAYHLRLRWECGTRSIAMLSPHALQSQSSQVESTKPLETSYRNHRFFMGNLSIKDLWKKREEDVTKGVATVDVAITNHGV